MKNNASLANFAALGLLGAVLAYWTWAWLGPAPVARAPAALQAAGGTPGAGGLFGVPRGAAAAAGQGTVRLMGVVAASRGRLGHAVLRLEESKTVAVLQGEHIEPGLRLAEIHVDHIVLERNGARETLAWPEKKGK